jgi:hypothetical protein
METHDSRVVHARQFLIRTRNQKPAELAPDVLAREDAELRQCLAWALDVIDDFADTTMDEEVTQTDPAGWPVHRAEGLRHAVRLLQKRSARAGGPGRRFPLSQRMAISATTD